MPPENLPQYSERDLQHAKAESQAQRFEPLGLKPTLEQELEKVVAERHARAGGLDRAITGPSSAIGGGVRPRVSPPGAPRVAATAQTIVGRLVETTQRLRELRDIGGAVTQALAGSVPHSTGTDAAPMPAETIFELYANAIDEIDRIIDNVVSDQARARAALG